MDGSEHGCIDPVPVLTQPKGRDRCKSQEDCSPDSACVAPHKKAQLMRLTVQPSTSEEGAVVLWSGPPREIWEAGTTLNSSHFRRLNLTRAPIVIVGNWLPRAPFFALWIPLVVRDFWE